MTDNPKDPPLEPLESTGNWTAQVIDLASLRIQAGRTPYKFKACQHLRMIYDQSERRIWCQDCERTIDNFDAYMTLARHFEKMLREANHKMQVANEALQSSARRRATKQLDRAWGTMAVCCPHCRGGLLPEDFVNMPAACSREIEIARRKAKRE